MKGFWACAVIMGSVSGVAALPARAQTASSGPQESAGPVAQDRVSSTEGAQVPPASTATQPDPALIGDIVVTAQKRSESVQRTPLAITAVGGDTLRKANITDIAALTQTVPNLILGQTLGSANVTIRGISLNALNFGVENPVAFHVDGVYFARPAAVLASFYDVERVEVLRGAQGTLYGRNATGGSINLVTTDPTNEYSAYAQITAGNYKHVAAEGAVSGPITDTLSARIAFRTDYHDGYGTNETTGRKIDDNEEQSIRGKLLFRPTPDLSILLSGDYTAQRGRPALHYLGTNTGALPNGVTLLGGRTPTKVTNIASDFDPARINDFWGFGATVSYDIGDITIRSVTGYRRTDAATYGDVDGTSASLLSPAVLQDNARQFSEELQVVGHTDRSNWIIGGYYFYERDDGAQAIGITNAFLPILAGVPIAQEYLAQGYYSGSQVRTRAYAAFGQYTRKFGDLSVTLGGRYSIETKYQINQGVLDLFTPFNSANFGNVPTQANLTNPVFSGVQCAAGLPTIGFTDPSDCTPKKTFRAFTPKVGVEYQITPSTMIYGSFSQGFKSGNFNFGVAARAVNPEKLDDYEAGVKSTFLGGKVRVNLSGFYYNYRDLQVNTVRLTSVILENAASAKVYGVEADVIVKPLPQLQFDASGAYLHTEFTDFISADVTRPGGDGRTVDRFGQPAFNLRGNVLPQSPKVSGKAGAAYTLPTGVGDFTLRGEAVYSDKIYFTQFNLPNASVRSRTRFNASLNYDMHDGLTASLNAKNLGNKRLISNGFVASALTGGAVLGYVEPPLTVDFTVGYRF